MEAWRPVPGHEGTYIVSDRGRVARLVKDHAVAHGYRAVNLSRGGRAVKHLVHRLVASAFCGGRGPGRDEVDHVDRDRAHNHASNLRWATRRENVRNRSCTPPPPS